MFFSGIKGSKLGLPAGIVHLLPRLHAKIPIQSMSSRRYHLICLAVSRNNNHRLKRLLRCSLGLLAATGRILRQWRRMNHLELHPLLPVPPAISQTLPLMFQRGLHVGRLLHLNKHLEMTSKSGLRSGRYQRIFL